MLTIDMILALSEDELRAYGTNALLECVEQATSRLFVACDDLAEVAACNLDAVSDNFDSDFDFECESEPYFGQQAYDRFAAFDELCRKTSR